jgi:hypothetical protein
LKNFASVALDDSPRTQADRTFDARQVNWETVLFGPRGATEIHGLVHTQDVDGDGNIRQRPALYNPQHTDIVCGDKEATLTGETEATLTGETFEGEAFTGTDAIVTKECE